jgi:riboflavin synthase
MFTGIVRGGGRVAGRQDRGGDLRLSIDAGDIAGGIDAARFAVGESIAVNGVCLTVVAFDGRQFIADVSAETLALTTLGACRSGEPVNLEPALRAGDPLGGHLLSGHVDGIATVVGMQADARSLRVQFEVPAPLARFIAPKGSVALDGVSLTINEVEGCRFGVNLIPHTMEVSTFGRLAVGQQLNLEVDQLARYLDRLLATRT